MLVFIALFIAIDYVFINQKVDHVFKENAKHCERSFVKHGTNHIK